MNANNLSYYIMRRHDKIKNMKKVNMLTEQRQNELRNVVKENTKEKPEEKEDNKE